MESFIWKGRLGPLELQVSPHTFKPSTISVLVAEALEVEETDTVMDVGSGCGILAIIAAKLGARHVHATDIAADAVEVGEANAARHGVGDRITFYSGSLFDPLPSDLEADVIIGDVSGIPDEIARESGWFPSGVGGGPTGSELPIRMLQAARERLRRGGRLLLPTGSIQDEPSILDSARSLFGNLRTLSEKLIPLPTPLALSDSVRRLIGEGVVKLTERGSRWLWTAKVWECRA
jgi:SAM-dependent methyltransferase